MLRGLSGKIGPALHPVLFAVIFSAITFACISVAAFLTTWVASGFSRLLPSENYWRLLSVFAGCAISGELLRGPVRAWRALPAGTPDYFAMAIGGAASGAWFVGYFELMWGTFRWEELFWGTAIGSASYVLLGACFTWEARQKARKDGQQAY